MLNETDLGYIIVIMMFWLNCYRPSCNYGNIYMDVAYFKSLLIAAICVSMTTGCSSLMQQIVFNSFEEKITTGDYQKASDYALKQAGFDKKNQKTADLLWSLQAGAALNFAGNYALSTDLLDISEAKIKSEDLENIAIKSAETAGSILGNDALLDYEPTYYDGVMANTYKAWNFLFDGKYNDARVELNRAEERQRRAVEHFANKIKAQQKTLKKEDKASNAKLTKSMSSSAMNRQLANAGIKQNVWAPYKGYVNPFTTYTYGLNLLVNAKGRSDYQKAAKSFERVYGITKSKTVKQDMALAQDLSRGKNLNKKYIWVILENGQSIAKEEVRVDLPIYLVNDNISYAGIALPKLKPRNSGVKAISVGKYKTQKVADMDQIIGSEFDIEFPYILAREITRSTLKTIAQKQIKDSNSIVGDIFSLGQILTTSADIRSFTALPKEYQVMRLPKDSNEIEIKSGNYKIPVLLDDKAVNHIVYVKVINPLVRPTVKVVNL